MVDHRASPGLPADFYKKIGLSNEVTPELGEGKLYESATMTCCHCNAIVIANPERIRPWGYCPKCNDYVCDNPGCHSNCTPFLKILDDAEKRAVRESIIQSSFVLKG